MRGTLSFHPVHLEFFDDVIQPLLTGRKIDPDPFVSRALSVQAAAVTARSYLLGLQHLITESTPPPAAEGASRWEKVRTWMERADYRAPSLASAAARVVDVDLHLRGRPFVITEGSADSVAGVVEQYLAVDGPPAAQALVREQLQRLGEEMGAEVEPDPDAILEAVGARRAELLAALKEVHSLAGAARNGENWVGSGGESMPALTALGAEMPWWAAALHSQHAPYWIADDVDGLSSVCRFADVPAPDCLVPAWRLFGEACDEFPALRDALDGELTSDRNVGAYVAPDDVPVLLAFLKVNGSRLIQAATRQGEGTACAVYLRKIKECATFAERQGLGYLEVSGLGPMGERLELSTH